MKNQTFGMFTAEGNYMVARIATAAEKLATADGFGEATDTDVRDQLHDVVCTAAGERCNFYL